MGVDILRVTTRLCCVWWSRVSDASRGWAGGVAAARWRTDGAVAATSACRAIGIQFVHRPGGRSIDGDMRATATSSRVVDGAALGNSTR